MPGTVGDDVTEQRDAEERQVADGVEHLVADELVLEAELVVEDAHVSSTTALSSEPPSVSPFLRSASTSFRKQNVLAGAISAA